jgi:tetratricopeptide (TPR) repeat protein
MRRLALHELLAHHSTEAGWIARAIVYWQRAGQRAVERSAYREAVTYFEQALRLLPHVPECRDTLEQAIDLRLDLRNALVSLAELERMYTYLREAETLAEALHDDHRLGRISAYLAHYSYVQGEQEQAIAFSQRTLALAAPLGEVGRQAGANYYLGQAYCALGDYHRALTFLRQNIVALDGALVWERFDLPYVPAVTSRTTFAWCVAELGAFAEGRARAEEGLQITEAVNHPASRILAYAGLGLLALRQGALQQAIPVLERGLALCHDAPFWIPRVASALGSAYALCGRLVEAIPLLEQAVQQATAVRVMSWQALWSAGLSEGYLLVSRLEDARQLAGRALEFSRARKERSHEAWTLRLLGEIARQEPPLAVEPVATYYHQALALAEELGMRPLQAHCHRGLGTLYAATGQRKQARIELSRALEMYWAMEMTFWLPQTETALAQVDT